MQEALKNPYYKEIWEKVNWKGRHPEKLSLNLALGSEYLQHPEECIKITSQDGIIKEVLGRPIILEDIINLFKKQEIKKGASDVEFCIFAKQAINKGADDVFISITGYVDTGEEPQYHYLSDCLYNITKPLHEQTPETWEKMANLI